MTAKEMFEKCGWKLYRDDVEMIQYHLNISNDNGYKSHSSFRFIKNTHKLYYGTTDVTDEWKSWDKHWIDKIQKQIEELGW